MSLLSMNFDPDKRRRKRGRKMRKGAVRGAAAPLGRQAIEYETLVLSLRKEVKQNNRFHSMKVSAVMCGTPAN